MLHKRHEQCVLEKEVAHGIIEIDREIDPCQARGVNHTVCCTLSTRHLGERPFCGDDRECLHRKLHNNLKSNQDLRLLLLGIASLSKLLCLPLTLVIGLIAFAYDFVMHLWRKQAKFTARKYHGAHKTILSNSLEYSREHCLFFTMSKFYFHVECFTIFAIFSALLSCTEARVVVACFTSYTWHWQQRWADASENPRDPIKIIVWRFSGALVSQFICIHFEWNTCSKKTQTTRMSKE